MTKFAERKIRNFPGSMKSDFTKKKIATNKRASLFAWTVIDEAGKPYWREKLSTVDPQVLTSLDQLLFYWKYYLLFYKAGYLD